MSEKLVVQKSNYSA